MVSSFSVRASAPLATRKAATSTRAARVSVKARATSAPSAQQQKLMAAVTAGVAATMSTPLAAEAAMTPSLQALLNSVVAGGLIFVVLFGAVTLVANFDPLSRR